MIDATFEWLKSDLGLCPNFHQKDKYELTCNNQCTCIFRAAPILNKLECAGKFVSYCGKKDNHSQWEIPFGGKGVFGGMFSQARVIINSPEVIF